MAKKNINKIKSELEEAKAKVIALEAEQKLAEETLQKEIGKIYMQIQFKKDKNLSYEEILSKLKSELTLVKEEEKEQRLAVKKAREEAKQNEAKTQDFSVEIHQN
ncbi:hypothetical protein [Streptococcus intermedius]|uniref:hypothetical protein n=2 Tax=Streptococcus intermedius TaxID=1338 RepID=UPI00025B5230|nr:hypothetical protein [Streptococcus intermedius]EID82473.1 hypothetical protein HMPREF1109_1751 [Streptococcus intermedius SK54 = ATCC 27335]BAM23399.1 hypothetical protein SCIM_0745 [Streptococcus intermedius JTH08]SQH51843.1 Uncharacterised protein [Streptococcus intermedius]